MTARTPIWSLLLGVFLVVLIAGPFALGAQNKSIALPPPVLDGKVSVEKAIATWRATRKFAETPLTVAQVGQILWAAYGKIETDAKTGATRRAIPSAWKAYPLDVYLMVGNKTVTDLPAGTYRYDPDEHALEVVEKGDKRTKLSHSARGRKWLLKVPIAIVLCGDFERINTDKATLEQWTNRIRSEAGMAVQNLILQACALDLAGNTVPLFNEAELAKVFKLPDSVKPMLVLGLGK